MCKFFLSCDRGPSWSSAFQMCLVSQVLVNTKNKQGVPCLFMTETFLCRELGSWALGRQGGLGGCIDCGSHPAPAWGRAPAFPAPPPPSRGQTPWLSASGSLAKVTGHHVQSRSSLFLPLPCALASSASEKAAGSEPMMGPVLS